MKPTMEILTKLQENSKKNHDEVFTRLYRYLLRPDIYYVAYQHLYSNKGAGTKGVTDDTADGFSEIYIENIIEALKNEMYQPKPVRRTYIKKSNGKMRPLGLPVFTDKLIQEAIRMILEAIYEPIFSDYSHGFRPARSCHTALAQIKKEFTGARWFIEGDIKGCFDNINHAVLVEIINQKIKDARFLKLIRSFLKAGYMEDWKYHKTYEYYDGERGSIPDEYRVMTFQDDLPEEEKSEWAMDIAFDMDEFFRQNDPQYAAEHPEAHAAKEELYKNLMAGRISALDEKLAALGQTQEDYLPSEIEKFKDATGYEEFLDFDPAEVKAALEDPEKSHADEMLSAAERAASEKMTVLVVEPMKEPYVKEIDPDLHSLQAEVGGDIGATYPYSDPVALVCNDEGKLIGLDLNRGLRDEDGEIYDIVAGTFLVVGLGEEDFASLSPELIQKYTEQFKTPERFMQINGNIVVLPVPAEKQDLAYLPDRFETGERVQTPRGSFQVTAMSREQMEAAGYGVHHISDDGKYLIMGNGTRAFAVAAEQPEKDNPLRTAEMTLEDDYGMIDGVINNGRRGEELEKAQEYAERTTPEKPSIRERLEDAKRECAEHKPPEGKKPGRDVPEHDCL